MQLQSQQAEIEIVSKIFISGVTARSWKAALLSEMPDTCPLLCLNQKSTVAISHQHLRLLDSQNRARVIDVNLKRIKKFIPSNLAN